MTETNPSLIQERYQRILEQIAGAAARAGRPSASVRVVVVSKFQPLDVLRAAIAAGITTFGENYAEEAAEKIAALPAQGLEWHMIGHVQSRKAGLVAGNFALLHSLDSAKLAERLDRTCNELQRQLPVLLEFNVSGEQSKFGFPAWDESCWPALGPELERILACSRLQVRGLMTMPPFLEDPERTRPYFQQLRRLQEFLAGCYPGADWRELSMGTSVDFAAAVQEGATIVRVGQAILGPRSVQ